MSWTRRVVNSALGTCLGSFALACATDLAAQDISLDGMHPVQAIFDNVPLVLNKRTTMQLRITSTFSADKQMEVRLAKNDGSGVLALVTDETGQHVNFTTARTHLTVHPGSDTYFWPPTFAPLIDFPTMNLNDILPDANPWCVTLTLNPGADDANPANNSATSCFTAKETRPFPTLIVAVGSTTSCDDLTGFEDKWHALFLGAYPTPEFPTFRGAQIQNGRDLSSKSCPGTAPPIMGSEAVEGVLATLDTLRTGTDFEAIVGVTKSIGTLPGSAAGWAVVGGAFKSVWILDKDTINFAATGLQEIAHTLNWVTAGAPNECRSGHLCNVPAPGYWVARDAAISSVFDFMNPDASSAFQWVSGETYQYLLNALRVGPDPRVIEVRTFIKDDGVAVPGPWFQFDARPDVALGDPGNLVFHYLSGNGKELAHAGTYLRPTRLSDGRVLNHNYVTVRIPLVSGATLIRATLNGKTLFERRVSSNAPALRLVNPRSDATVSPGDRVSVDWEGSDADQGDRLTYTVFTRRDGNSPWIPLAVNTTNTHLDYLVPADFSSRPALIRVLATDGVNTSEVVTGQNGLTPPRRPPSQ